eukprot:SAG31_NODE_309_length_17949_cov_11.083361_10_plen_141_part_00
MLTNTNAAGKIVLLQRGNCAFVQQAMNAQTAGAIAVIIYNNKDGGAMGMAAVATESLDQAAAQRLGREVTIPVVSISQADGGQLAAAQCGAYVPGACTAVFMSWDITRHALFLARKHHAPSCYGNHPMDRTGARRNVETR